MAVRNDRWERHRDKFHHEQSELLCVRWGKWRSSHCHTARGRHCTVPRHANQGKFPAPVITYVTGNVTYGAGHRRGTCVLLEDLLEPLFGFFGCLAKGLGHYALLLKFANVFLGV